MVYDLLVVFELMCLIGLRIIIGLECGYLLLYDVYDCGMFI